ncbi:NAD-dependent protein deacylase [Priestia taiwanensis]|uniref:protein acetyllysine N-acetyltransferase n=1 Tax=Priestia taiwanensis TaxID=1347902 RepID=A0A917ANC9_9BACI|nr:NAD-dependent protein deacylase [Priestia taiwanensis]GGE62742.1 NAD-dependent protein deacetylase [Priestia taiwanensis]
MKESYDKVKKLVSKSGHVVFLTGAGMSTESGIPDFRSKGGLYDREEDITYYLSTYYFQKDPIDFWRFYKELFQLEVFSQYRPNRGHEWIASLETINRRVTVITQNIDGLHQQSGSKHIVALHGDIQKAHCPLCRREYEMEYLNKMDTPVCEDKEHTQTVLKPNVVLFGDVLPGFEEALQSIETCDLFIVMGTSLEVYPANQLPLYAKNRMRIPVVLVNKEQTKMDIHFDEVCYTTIGNFVNAMIKGGEE